MYTAAVHRASAQAAIRAAAAAAGSTTKAIIGSGGSRRTSSRQSSSGGGGGGDGAGSNAERSSKNRLPLGGPVATVSALDHLVLTVSSLEASVRWYTSVLGMRHVIFGPNAPPASSSSSLNTALPTASAPRRRHALAFGRSKINLHEAGREFEPKAAKPGPGTADLCFLIREDVEGLPARFEAAGVEVLMHDEGDDDKSVAKEVREMEKKKKTAVVTRTGARGPLRSIYLRDPDGNLIELSNYKTSPEEDDDHDGTGSSNAAREGEGEDGYKRNVEAEEDAEERDQSGVIPTPS
ncbi:Glyoxalase/Bleomycin resistance protein/Dihydroxybiphenyl dioxygenase [Microdochium bolleyi]|uniref:Glyoxalase/Bleomycin resistance protein/Dihydroxybiphenyl dioxygenase n=1 Tax=Microdochium bolleyi TaxID=196109 RepID=A0A136J0T7_9PEZI|nr:Glyoxalase/Bleomycin resistance protein/Dihydroxybiphenyl dioxygenase [Microdochium bolleyi]